jgi:hypothetical protein
MLKDRWSEYRMNASERPKIKYEYFVSGKGEFPIDMLRFDCCWPRDSEDAHKMIIPFGEPERAKVRSIRMCSYYPPTIARWQSFLWSVGTEKL